jgi:hypothetical protein
MKIKPVTITMVLALHISTFSFAQEHRKLSGYLSTQYTKTIYDITLPNNPWAMGLGFQTLLNNKTKFKPTIEFTTDAYLEDDKVYRIIDGKDYGIETWVKNLFAGVSYYPDSIMYVSFAGGPSFINGNNYFGVKTSLGCYFSKDKRWTTKISYINVFNRNPTSKSDFGSISLSLGFRFF